MPPPAERCSPPPSHPAAPRTGSTARSDGCGPPGPHGPGMQRPPIPPPESEDRPGARSRPRAKPLRPAAWQPRTASPHPLRPARRVQCRPCLAGRRRDVPRRSILQKQRQRRRLAKRRPARAATTAGRTGLGRPQRAAVCRTGRVAKRPPQPVVMRPRSRSGAGGRIGGALRRAPLRRTPIRMRTHHPQTPFACWRKSPPYDDGRDEAQPASQRPTPRPALERKR